MKTISIQTTQNVKIDYELAAWGDRLLAFIIDSAILYFCIWMFYFALPNAKYFHYLITIPIFVLFALASETLTNGQSIGKKIIGIKIVKLNSSTIRTSDFAIRWLFRFLDLYGSLGLLATLFVSSSQYRQRLGDMLASTVVVRLQPKSKLTLTDLLRIQTTQNYQPKYLQAIRLKENDVLTIKNLLDDFRDYPNDAHAHLMDEGALKVLQIMGLSDHQEERHLDFMRIVLKDYVVLTR